MTPPCKLEVDQPEYPAALRGLPHPPPVLHVRGRREQRFFGKRISWGDVIKRMLPFLKYAQVAQGYL